MGISDEIKKGIDNVKDALDEAGHKGAAEAEQTRRDVAGDTMTPGEKIGSVVNQGRHEVEAGIDHVKQDVRNNT